MTTATQDRMGPPAPLEEGREMDALVAEKVMEWRHEASSEEDALHRNGGFPRLGFTHYRDSIGLVRNPVIPRYSTDIVAAWTVVEKLRVTGHEVYIYDERETANHARGWEVCVSSDKDDYSSKLCESAPLAICRAALAALTTETTG